MIWPATRSLKVVFPFHQSPVLMTDLDAAMTQNNRAFHFASHLAFDNLPNRSEDSGDLRGAIWRLVMALLALQIRFRGSNKLDP